MIIGLDFETTGLDTDTLEAVEIAVILYDDDLNEVDSYEKVVYYPEDAWSDLNPVVYKMHLNSGLLHEATDGEFLPEVQLEVALLFQKWNESYDLRRAPLMGNSVHFDRAILRRLFRESHDLLSHRNIDASSLTELAKRWEPEIIPTGHMSHRAIEDVRESARVLLEYRKTWLKIPWSVRLQRWWSKIIGRGSKSS